MKQEFIFSFSREAMLKRCWREYFLHAFYAYGEYEVGTADSERNYIHLLKQLKSENAFKEFLLSESLRKIFIDGMTVEDLPRALRYAFYRAKDCMLLGAYEEDHLANPLLRSFYYDEINIEDTFTDLHNELSNWAARLLENDLFLKLFREERQNFYIENDIAWIYVGDIKMYFPLLGVINSGGHAYCISFVRNKDFFETSAVLNLLYCQSVLHIPPHNVRHVFLNENDTLTLFADNEKLNISQTLDDIIKRAASHLDCTAELKDFTLPFSVPEAESRESCRFCRFREFCIG